MADGSWDNGGVGVPTKTGLPTWGKVLLGCGITAVVVMVTCAGGLAYVANRVSKDPKAFESKVKGWVLEQARPEWEDFRTVVAQLHTDAACRSLYAAQPALADTWPTEQAFLTAAARWRKDLAPVPDLTPDLLDGDGLQLKKGMGGKVTLGWRPKKGPSVSVTFGLRPHPKDPAPRQILALEVRAPQGQNTVQD